MEIETSEKEFNSSNSSSKMDLISNLELFGMDSSEFFSSKDLKTLPVFLTMGSYPSSSESISNTKQRLNMKKFRSYFSSSSIRVGKPKILTEPEQTVTKWPQRCFFGRMKSMTSVKSNRKAWCC